MKYIMVEEKNCRTRVHCTHEAVSTLTFSDIVDWTKEVRLLIIVFFSTVLFQIQLYHSSLYTKLMMQRVSCFTDTGFNNFFFSCQLGRYAR